MAAPPPVGCSSTDPFPPLPRPARSPPPQGLELHAPLEEAVRCGGTRGPRRRRRGRQEGQARGTGERGQRGPKRKRAAAAGDRRGPPQQAARGDGGRRPGLRGGLPRRRQRTGPERPGKSAAKEVNCLVRIRSGGGGQCLVHGSTTGYASHARGGRPNLRSAMWKRSLEIDATRTATAERGGRIKVTEEPVIPTGRLFREPHFSCYIVSVFGLGGAVDLAAVRAGLEATLARHPRFCSVQVMCELEEDPTPKWVRTTVNIDDHVIVPELDHTATSANSDRALEDYVSSLSTLHMDHSRPLWELHVLDFPTSEASAALVLRVHHSVGDGVSLLSLFIACTRRASDQASLPALPTTAGRRAGPVYALSSRPQISASWGALAAFAAWVMSLLVLVWNTVVDVVCFAATATSILGDPPTLFKGAEGVEFRPKRFMNRTLSLDDVKYVKNAVNCTINDVLLGVTSAALSRYYLRKTGESGRESIKVRSTLLVNLRKTPGLHTLADMMESGKDNGAQWGNRLGYMILPFHIAQHNDPLEYVRKATQVARRKKSSMESVFTFWSGSIVMKIFGIKAAASLCYGMMMNTTLSFSNVAGPTEQVVFYGHPIVYIAPSVYGHPHALTMHYQSYANIIKLVLAVDEAQFPDAHDLLDDFDQSLRLIQEAASEKPKDTCKNVS